MHRAVWILRNRLNPFPVSAVMTGDGETFALTLNAMAAEAFNGWVEELGEQIPVSSVRKDGFTMSRVRSKDEGCTESHMANSGIRSFAHTIPFDSRLPPQRARGADQFELMDEIHTKSQLFQSTSTFCSTGLSA